MLQIFKEEELVRNIDVVFVSQKVLIFYEEGNIECVKR